MKTDSKYASRCFSIPWVSPIKLREQQFKKKPNNNPQMKPIGAVGAERRGGRRAAAVKIDITISAAIKDP